jgi:hypothetical protein
MLVNNRVVTDCKPRSKAQEKQKLLSLWFWTSGLHNCTTNKFLFKIPKSFFFFFRVALGDSYSRFGAGLRLCLSNKFPDDGDVVVDTWWMTRLGNHGRSTLFYMKALEDQGLGFWLFLWMLMLNHPKSKRLCYTSICDSGTIILILHLVTRGTS